MGGDLLGGRIPKDGTNSWAKYSAARRFHPTPPFPVMIMKYTAKQTTITLITYSLGCLYRASVLGISTVWPLLLLALLVLLNPWPLAQLLIT